MQYPYHDNLPNPTQSAHPAASPTIVQPPTQREHNISRIGMPILFASGPYAGQTIRAQIQEIQKPDLGRKFAKRDRRPLDPPPVVQLRMYQVFNAETDHPTEQEIPPDQVEVGGLVCHVDLYAIRPQSLPSLRGGEGSSSPIASTSAGNFNQMVTPIPPPEDAKATDALFGTTFSVASQIKGLDGNETIIYVFSDLSVRTEGIFILRYRMFDIFSRMEGSEDIPVLAECHGGPFAIYSTKEFPGLRASTELTKHLSRYGIRVNLREAERKRKPVEPLMPPPAVPSISPPTRVAAPVGPVSVVPPPVTPAPAIQRVSADEDESDNIRQGGHVVSTQSVESDTDTEVT